MPQDLKVSLDGRVRVEVQRGADTPDFFSTVPTRDLQAILRSGQTLPIEDLVNTGAISIDVPNQRIFRDIYWKGSFAADSVLGWEERVRTENLHPEIYQHAKIFAGGSFWKRFDRVENGVATGQVVNYNIEWLPGDPEVRSVPYPDDQRTYFHKGQTILLLHYRNDPYRQVYDTIKIIDQNNAVGVMHVGEFPNGTEFATFVLARYNYPFELATDNDRKLIAAATTMG
ncbi:MAG: hypothetical protein WBY44_08020 [Bryobacteraceae bacterium]|jgi:hypothetical protein